MKRKHIRTKSWMLALCLCLLLGGFALSAQAETGETTVTTVIITGMEPSAIEAAINTALESNDLVIVTGTKTNATEITFSIPENKKVVWQATYTGRPTTASSLISVTGGAGTFTGSAGTLELAEGALIESSKGTKANTYAIQSLANIVVTGGEVTTATPEGNNHAIRIHGDLTMTGGKVSSTGGYAIYTDATNNTVTVTGGTVSTPEGYAIYTNGTNNTVTVNGGTVSTTGGEAIYTAYGKSSAVTVSRGIVEATERGYAIRTFGTDCTIEVSGGKVSSNGGAAIETNGSVEISGANTVVEATAENGIAIDAEGNVTITGATVRANAKNTYAIYASAADDATVAVTVRGGTVEAIGNGATAISISGDKGTGTVTVSDGAVVKAGGSLTSYAIRNSASTGTVTVSGANTKIEATDSYAISCGGNANVVVEGGTIRADKNVAIMAKGNVTVRGGTILSVAEKQNAIYTNGSVEVTGGTVRATGAESTAITAAYGSALSTVTVSGDNTLIEGAGRAILTDGTVTISGGTVRSTGASATVHVNGGGDITVSGGLVFGYSKEIVWNYGVIYGTGFKGATGNGMVIAWDSTASSGLPIRSSEGIRFLPDTATASWGTSGTQNGIVYKNGSNKGFIPLDVTLTKITLTKDDLNYSIPDRHIYTGLAQPLDAITMKGAHSTNFNETTGGTIQLLYNGAETAPKNAGTYAITAKISGGTEYNAVDSISLGSYTIDKKELTATGGTVKDKVFDGTKTATVTALTFDGLVNSEALTFDTDYKVSDAQYISTYVALHDNVWCHVALTDTQKASNYVLSSLYVRDLTGSITKAAAPSVPPQKVSVYMGADSTGNTLNLAELLPANRDETEYRFPNNNTLVTYRDVDRGVLTFETRATVAPTSENITVEVTMLNYKDTTITIAVFFVDRKVPTVTPVIGSNATLTYGQPLSTLSITATALSDGTQVPGKIEWNNDSEKPAVGAAAQGWIFTPDNTTTYQPVTGSAPITVNKAKPSGTPTCTTISSADKTLADAVLSGTFTNPYDKSEVSGELKWVLEESTPIVRGTSYDWTFTPKDGSAANYEVATGSLTPYPNNDGGGGNGGGGGGGGGGGTVTPPSNDTKTEVGDTTITTPGGKKPVVNADGTTSLPGGGTVETGSGAKVDVPAGTVVEKDGSVTVPAGKEAEVKLPGGAEVTIPGGSTVSKEGDITVGSGKAEVTLPSGTEVTLSEGSTINDDKIVVGPDGASVQGNDGEIYTFEEGDVLVLDEDVPLGFFAQSQTEGSFGDVKETDWFFEAISFVSESGIMNGTGNGEFDPGSKLDRSMMAQVLWNLAGNPATGDSSFGDVQSGDWFAGAVAWAAESGIVNGIGGDQFGPDQEITREQMAVMLHNYCKLMNIELPLVREGESFADAGEMSDWAAEAVQAMYAAGVLNGKGGGAFDPQGTATRAEVAQMMTNFMLSLG